MPPENEQQKFDLRVYIGIVFFRWQVIAVCFLYCLLGGVLYLHLAQKVYKTKARIMVYRDPNLEITADRSPWRSLSSHTYLLQSEKLRDRVVRRLHDDWAEIMGSIENMELEVDVSRAGVFGPMLEVSVDCKRSNYAEDFLSALLDEHRQEWQSIQMESSESASRMLEQELARLEDKIKSAEDDLIEFQRLHDLTRVDIRAGVETRYLEALVQRRSQLTTELMLLEATYPALKSSGPGVISAARELSRGTAEVEAMSDQKAEEEMSSALVDRQKAAQSNGSGPAAAEGLLETESGWQELRVQIEKLETEKRRLARDLEPSHPRVKAVQAQIDEKQRELDVQAGVEWGRLQDRHRALLVHLKAIEAAEYKWQAKNLLASQRQAELSRIANVVERYVQNYQTLYKRLHDMRVEEELKAEHFRIVEPVETEEDPVWPDPVKVLLMVLALGLGSGFGLAFLAQAVDNKVQSIKDVEEGLGIEFLGGVPYWAHSGLERIVRPIVTEHHSTGAIEAYRALRTSLIAALQKANEKIVFVTSADAREGKTLTTLNLAIMIAQMGKRVLLVDMDLRRGRMHRSLGVEKKPGVTDALKGAGRLEDFIKQSRIENLDVVPCGDTLDNSAELLQTAGLVEMFVDVQDEYDYIFIDTSPVLRVTDTVIVTTQGIGAVIYIARVNKTPKPLIRYSLDMLRDAKVVGLIMNSIEMHKVSSIYYTYQYPNYAYYSNAYAYGYDYYNYGDKRRHKGRRPPSSRVRELKEWLRRTFLPID